MATGDIKLSANFQLNTAKPLDARDVVADTAARDAISALLRYQGMKCFVVSEEKLYWLKSGITNDDWEEFKATGGGGSGGKNYFVDPNFSEDVENAVPYNDYLSEDFPAIGSPVNTSGDYIQSHLGFEAENPYDIVVYTTTGMAIGGLTAGESYYRYSDDSGINRFYLASSKGGSKIDLTSQGTGTHTFTRIYFGSQGTATVDHLSRSVETTAPLAGPGSLKISYTYDSDDAGGGVGEGIRLETKTIDREDRGKALPFTVYIDPTDENYPSGDLNFRVFDKTNSKELYVTGDTSITNEEGTYRLLVYTTSTTAEINFTLNLDEDNATSSYALKFGTFSLGPGSVIPTEFKISESAIYQGQAGYGSTATKIPYFTNEVSSDLEKLGEVENSSVNGFSYTALVDHDVTFTYNCRGQASTASEIGITLNSEELTTGIGLVTNDTRVAYGAGASSVNGNSVTFSGKLVAGDVLRPHTSAFASAATQQCSLTILAQGTAGAMLSTTELLNKSTDILCVGNAGQSIVAGTTDIPFTEVKDVLDEWDGDTFTPRESGRYRIIGNTWFTSSAIREPALYEDGNSFKRMGLASTSNSQHGIVFEYDLEAGKSYSIRALSNGGTLDNSSPSSQLHWLSIKRAFDPTAFIASIEPKTAYIKDVKTAGVAGGTFTSGAWRTRDLNTLTGDTDFISINSNQFTLQPGAYDLEASAPANGTVSAIARHKAVLYNVTDSTYDLIGTSETTYDPTGSSTAASSSSKISGRLVLSSPKTFEIRHQCAISGSTSGFGIASNFGVSEVYTQVKVTKVK